MIDLKKRRLELGLTMLEVAKIVGVSEATISRYESGEIKNMRSDRINKYAKALSIDSSLLIEEIEWDKTVEELNKEFENRNNLLKAYLDKVFDDEDSKDLAHALILQLPRLNTDCLNALNIIVGELASKEENINETTKEFLKEIGELQ